MNTVTIIVLLFCLLINIYECPVTRARKDGSRKHSECANKGKCENVIRDPQEKYKGRKTADTVHVYTCMEKSKSLERKEKGTGEDYKLCKDRISKQQVRAC